MLLEMIDALRCPHPHEDSPLVASISRRSDRDIVDGVLGCAICGREYPIENGVARFGSGFGEAGNGPRDAHAEPPEEIAMRCAAMLDLFDPGGMVALGGRWGSAAAELHELAKVLVLLVDPPPGVRLGNGVAALSVGEVLPFAPGMLRGIALDERTSIPSIVSSAVRALRGRGRLIAAARVPLPAGVTERARDDAHWVAEADAPATAPIRLMRGR